MNRQYFQSQLELLMADTLALGSRVEEALQRAMEAVLANDLVQMEQVIASDREINELAQRLHERAITMIARQQPMARDLREISVVMSLLPELERMADHAASCCKIARRMNQEPNFTPIQAMPGIYPRAVPEMGERVLRILRNGLDALSRRDAALAEQLGQEDDAIDALYRQLFKETIEIARTQPEYGDEAIHLLTMAHNLERIGDRVTNIAEQVIFLLRGQVVELNN
jgi:phosphate transport system protein